MVARLHQRTHFTRLRAHGTTVREGKIRVVCAPPDPDSEIEGPALAFAVPRAFGTAVMRNRVRRRLRAVVHELEHAGEIPIGWFLVNVLPGAAEPGYGQLRRWFSDVMARPEVRDAVGAP
ncbi:MAG: ribonuclease P protein component [Microthrixaceae bacterium]